MKTFLRLLKNFIILSIPLVLLSAYAFINPMGYMTVEYPMWAEEKNAIKGGIEDKKTLIIGDSRAKSGLIPYLLNEDNEVYNIAIGGATSIEMYYAARKYLKNHEAPENAVVIFAPCHFCQIDNWQQTLYYNYLSLPEVLEVEWNAIKYGEKSINYQGSLSDVLSFYLRLPNKYMDAMVNARFTGNSTVNREKYDSVRSEGGYTFFGNEDYNDQLNYEAHYEGFDHLPMVDHYYIRLLDLLRNEGINVIIEQSPINDASARVIKEEFYEGYREYMDDIESRYPEFTMEKVIPVYDNSFFGDNNHMNRRGAERFTAEFREKYDGVLF